MQHGKQLLEKLDTNKDGTVDLGEIDKHIRAEMYTAEYIKNHKYTPADVETRVKEDAEEMLDMIDSNHDKKLELQECVDHFMDDEEASERTLFPLGEAAQFDTRASPPTAHSAGQKDCRGWRLGRRHHGERSLHPG